MSKYWFTSDEHMGHRNIIKYTNRPFDSVEEMDEIIIQRHNEVVEDGDTVIHAGDYTLVSNRENVERKYIQRLNGKHIFISGSHDKWLGKKHPIQIFERTFNSVLFVICHYALHEWALSHYGSYMLYGHSHNRLFENNQEPVGKVLDIGVDGHNFYPWSLDEIFEYMKDKPDNWNLLRK